MISFTKKQLDDIGKKGGTVRGRDTPPAPKPAKKDNAKPLADALMASQQAHAQTVKMMLAKLAEAVEAQVAASKALSERIEALAQVQRSSDGGAELSPALDALTRINNDSAKSSSAMVAQLGKAVEMLRNPAQPRAYNFSIRRDEKDLMTEVIATPVTGPEPIQRRGLSLLGRRSD